MCWMLERHVLWAASNCSSLISTCDHFSCNWNGSVSATLCKLGIWLFLQYRRSQQEHTLLCRDSPPSMHSAGRLANKERKRTITEELLADPDLSQARKRRFDKLQVWQQLVEATVYALDVHCSSSLGRLCLCWMVCYCVDFERCKAIVASDGIPVCIWKICVCNLGLQAAVHKGRSNEV